jgi:hypothetical protein
VEAHGDAVIEITLGRTCAVRGCRLPDGTRGSVITGEPIHELRDGTWVDSDTAGGALYQMDHGMTVISRSETATFALLTTHRDHHGN